MTVCITKEEKMKAEAAGNFIGKMKSPAFVALLMAGAGVDQTPCFCCLRQVQRTCPHVVGEVGCQDYALYSQSPEKVEAKLHERIAECLQSRQVWTNSLQRKAA